MRGAHHMALRWRPVGAGVTTWRSRVRSCLGADQAALRIRVLRQMLPGGRRSRLTIHWWRAPRSCRRAMARRTRCTACLRRGCTRQQAGQAVAGEGLLDRWNTARRTAWAKRPAMATMEATTCTLSMV
jgi:hypothetical protein